MGTATQEQQRVADNMSQNGMVIALPGSGKSFTMKQGVKNILVLNRGARIAMVTFTRAATDALKVSLEGMLDKQKFSRCQINTFHGFINQQAREAGFKGTVLIGNKQNAIIRRSIKNTGSQADIKEASQMIDAIGRELNPATISSKFNQSQIGLYNEYLALCRKDNAADYNALSRLVLVAMKKGSITPLKVDYLVVDEVQDTDSVQFSWIVEHTKRGIVTNIVGDDDQTIYSFRNAGGVKIFRQFEELFRPNVYYLTSCFRCAPEILRAAETVIKFNESRYDKAMNAARNDTGKVVFHASADLQSQIHLAVSLIEAEPEGWAVLCRNNNHLDELEGELKTPVMRIGGASFWDSEHPNELLSFFTFLRHPNDEKLLVRTLALLDEEEDVIDMIVQQVKYRVPFHSQTLPTNCQLQTVNLHASMRDWSCDTRERGVIRMRFAALANWLQMAGHTIKNRAGTDNALGAALKHCMKWAEKEGWLKMLNVCAGILQGNQKKNEVYDPSKVVLATLHGSKGLEWKKVIIISVNHDQIPSKKVVGVEGLEEERRLLYVGMTRAEIELHLIWYGNSSPFLTQAFEKEVSDASHNVFVHEDKEEQ